MADLRKTESAGDVRTCRKEELFPADAFGLFYLQITRIPGGWHRHAEYEIFYHISGPIVFEVASPDA